MAKNATKKKHARRAEATRARSLHTRYPLYVPTQPGEAEAELGPERAAELLELYTVGDRYPSATLTKATVALEKILQTGAFKAITREHPGGRAWTVEQYRQAYNAAHEGGEFADEYYKADEASVINWLHDMHDMGLYFLDRDDFLREEPTGEGLLD